MTEGVTTAAFGDSGGALAPFHCPLDVVFQDVMAADGTTARRGRRSEWKPLHCARQPGETDRPESRERPCLSDDVGCGRG